MWVIFRSFKGPTEMGVILEGPQEEVGQEGCERLPGKQTEQK